MSLITLSSVAPSSFFEEEIYLRNKTLLKEIGFDFCFDASARNFTPAFLNGSSKDRLDELYAAEQSNGNAMWAVRGGTGAIDLWDSYAPRDQKFLIGYSDITLLLFQRFYLSKTKGIHGPVITEAEKNQRQNFIDIKNILQNNLSEISYPKLKAIHCSTTNTLSGELLVMNLASLHSIAGCFDKQFLNNKFLALEDIGEEPYKVWRMLKHLNNLGLLEQLSGLIIGDFNLERQKIMDEIFSPLAREKDLWLFDFPFFGHQKNNQPLIFGQNIELKDCQDQQFSLHYLSTQ